MLRLLATFALYLMAIVDVFSRRVMAWRLSNTLTVDFCIAALEEALRRCGSPEVFNTDQGSQFTSQAFIEVLEQARVRQRGWPGRLCGQCIH
jgi:putative transposase